MEYAVQISGLSDPQAQKLRNDNTMQIRPNQYGGNITVYLSKRQHTRFNKAKGNNVGFRFMAGEYSMSDNESEDEDADEITGGKFRIGRAFKRARRKVNKSVKTVTKTANIAYKSKAAKTVGNFAKKKGIDVAKMGGKEILKAVTNAAIDGGVEALSYGANYVAPGSDEFVKPALKQGAKLAKKESSKAINKINYKEFDNIKGKGLPKYKKGSVEAREHMARLRAMRGKKSTGGSFKSPSGGSFKSPGEPSIYGGAFLP